MVDVVKTTGLSLTIRSSWNFVSFEFLSTSCSDGNNAQAGPNIIIKRQVFQEGSLNKSRIRTLRGLVGPELAGRVKPAPYLSDRFFAIYSSARPLILISFRCRIVLKELFMMLRLITLAYINPMPKEREPSNASDPIFELSTLSSLELQTANPQETVIPVKANAFVSIC
ncbi:hypothetical protein ABW19_dt0207038 [Dactylella cylindrospora]|nr:hypothetical protein ABW19_dt0207038 [Dactylella cylindrospora]